MNAPGVFFDHDPGRRSALEGTNRKWGAFTFIELLAVIGIIGLLAVLLLPALSRTRENANAARCAGNLRSIGQAIALYANENNNDIPSVVDSAGITWDASLLPYLDDSPAVFHCPGDRPAPADSDKRPRTYAANGGVAYGVPPDELPFGSFWKDPTHKLASLSPGGGRLILVGERPGDSAANRGFVGGFAFCSLDVIPATLHRKGRGGLYLFADMSVEYLDAEQVAEAKYWYER